MNIDKRKTYLSSSEEEKTYWLSRQMIFILIKSIRVHNMSAKISFPCYIYITQYICTYLKVIPRFYTNVYVQTTLYCFFFLIILHKLMHYSKNKKKSVKKAWWWW